MSRHLQPAALDRRRALARIAATCWLGTATLAHAATSFDLTRLMQSLAQVKAGEASFVERRQVACSTRRIESSGRLSFEAPDTFVRETLKPRRERLAVNGNTLTISQGTRKPQRRARLRARSGGHRRSDARHAHRQPRDARTLFQRQLSGSAERWSLELVPRDARLRGQVASVRVTGQHADGARGADRDARRRPLGDDDRADRAGERGTLVRWTRCRAASPSRPRDPGNAPYGFGSPASWRRRGSSRAAPTSPTCRHSCLRRRRPSNRCCSTN